MGKKISIIVPVYNVEKYINDCVNSLIKQSYKDFEVIFVDDGSTDNSIYLIRDLIKGLNNFRIITKPNGGLSSARNFGIKSIDNNSEFITFVDSDDYLHEDYLISLIQQIGDNDICCCNYNEVSERGEFIREVRNEINLTSTSDLYPYIIESINFIPNAWGKLYRVNIIEKLVYPEGLLFEDFAIAYKVFFEQKITFTNLPLYNYRIRVGSIMRKFNENIISHKLIILEDLREFLKENKIYNKYKINYNNSYLFHGIFVTSCIIINQLSYKSLPSIYKLIHMSDKNIFNTRNVIKSNILPMNIRLYILMLCHFPYLAVALKIIQNKLGSK